MRRTFLLSSLEAMKKASQQFKTEFTGNGTTSQTINIPFEPDAIFLLGYDPTVLVGTEKIMMFICDMRAFGLPAGIMCVHEGNTNVRNTICTTNSYLTRYSRAENGDVTLENIINGVFATDIKYQLIAVKYTDKTDKEIITEFVEGLSDSVRDSLTINKAKVNAAFTDAEWAALIAKKPSWTFAMF